MKDNNFTGERPGWGEGFDYDEARHLAAYNFAMKFVEGKSVLDAGCGEGFGTHQLAEKADSVMGVDYSADSIEKCRELWKSPKLSFVQLDLVEPKNFSGTFEFVQCFQVLEHIEQTTPFLDFLKQRLSPNGKLLLTTPNRLMSFSENPYHVREYDPGELKSLLEDIFPKVTIMGLKGNQKVIQFDQQRELSVKRILKLDPLGIRKVLPRSIINFAFAKLAQLVRHRVRQSLGPGKISPEDFYVSGNDLNHVLDLVAICEV